MAAGVGEVEPVALRTRVAVQNRHSRGLVVVRAFVHDLRDHAFIEVEEICTIDVDFGMLGGKRCLGPRKDLIGHEFRQTNHRSPIEVGFTRVIDAGHTLLHAP